MDNFEFAEDGGSVVGQDHFLQVVDDEFVAAIGAQGGLHSTGDGAAGVDIASHGAIFCVVAVGQLVLVAYIVVLILNALLLVPWFEKPLVGRIWY